jgi:Ca2+-binding RTX toxin-like protein
LETGSIEQVIEVLISLQTFNYSWSNSPMTVKNGTNSDNVEYMSSWGAPVSPETAHGFNALAGNDTVYGSAYNDYIDGGSGNDKLYGNGGNDALLGQTGNDELYGGDGNDLLVGGTDDAGADWLDGGAGDDNMFGGNGDDVYVHNLNQGVDHLNDGNTAAMVPGYGGGEDILYMTGVNFADLRLYQDGNNLWVSSAADVADGVFNDSVVIEDFFLVETNTFVEWIYTADLQWINLFNLV